MAEQLKALIVDDEKDICYLLSEILKGRNIQVSFVNSISDAEKLLQEEHPNIIFLDNFLPDGFGIDFIDTIRSLYPEVKVIMITAHDTYTDRDKALLKGIDQFVGKPFTKETIFAALESIALVNE